MSFTESRAFKCVAGVFGGCLGLLFDDFYRLFRGFIARLLLVGSFVMRAGRAECNAWGGGEAGEGASWESVFGVAAFLCWTIRGL